MPILFWTMCPQRVEKMSWVVTFFGLPTTVSRASPRLICWSTRVAHLAWWVSLPTGIFCIHKRSNPRAPQTCLSDTKLLTTWTNPRWLSCDFASRKVVKELHWKHRKLLGSYQVYCHDLTASSIDRDSLKLDFILISNQLIKPQVK